ncbi:MAG: deoxyribonuclease V [Gemmataceae bacterium]|nr:deoxyribonuclease V [Gemmataceae bacterium]
MDLVRLHSWELTPKEAVALQHRLAGEVDTAAPLRRWRLVAGADVSYHRYAPLCYAAVVVLRAEDLEVVETQHAVGASSFPYVPGLLSFREAPVVLQAFARLQARPDVVMCDGQGLAHPRRFGLACHLGLWLNVPCLGCAKSRLIGTYREPGRAAGATTPLRDRGEIIGSVVRTKTGVKPLFVSPGHRIDLASAVEVVLRCCRGYRLPEPTRQAHRAVNELRRKAKAYGDR